MDKKAVLILEDGSCYEGYSFGAERSVSGEVVFNTGMTGYPETLTDPSYAGQILTCTYPLIGNYGVPTALEGNQLQQLQEHFESDAIQVKGLLLCGYPEQHNHWNGKKSLGAWLKEHNVPGLYGLDTRSLTKKLREKGTMVGKIIVGNQNIPFFDPSNVNLVAGVSIKEIKTFNEAVNNDEHNIMFVVVDCGIKHNIIRCLNKYGVKVVLVPWDFDFNALKYDGLFISNGPGDPKQCAVTINNLKKNLDKQIPTFGICLGNQLLALAAGADTYKLKYGHRGQNQPCIIEGSARAFITTQNHGYAVDETTLPSDWEVWWRNLNDGTVEGIKHKTLPFFGFQAHPEASAGPTDTEFLFQDFINVVKVYKHGRK
ncbi:glutamine-hydrolyzing carbamoyl-phosphate synthase small subunit [Candidatus Woesearchaeota archaeon]|nr:glutamine-hydrolyzing carbamoyl-phosphate synthase small subunit [Candidatus Woesearchaeota archaeon]